MASDHLPEGSLYRSTTLTAHPADYNPLESVARESYSACERNS